MAFQTGNRVLLHPVLLLLLLLFFSTNKKSAESQRQALPVTSYYLCMQLLITISKVSSVYVEGFGTATQ